jgi:hypothetical protein
LAIGCSGASGGDDNDNGGNPPTSQYLLTVDAPLSSSIGSGTVTVTGMLGGVTRSAQISVTVN